MCTHRPEKSECSEGAAEESAALGPPQFTLRTLLWSVAAAAVLVSAMTAAGPLGGLALLVLVLGIVAHVAGNAIGTRLREIGDRPCPSAEQLQRRPRRRVMRHEYAPPSSLARRTCLSVTMIAYTIAGAVLVGAGWGAALIWLAWSQLNVPTVVVAVASSTVLGGVLGFTASSFTQTAGGAWREARKGERRTPVP